MITPTPAAKPIHRRSPGRADERDRLGERRRQQHDERAAHPCEVRGIGALHGLRKDAQTEERACEQHTSGGTRPAPDGRAQIPNASRATASRTSSEEPGEQLLRRSEAREGPRQVEGGDHACDADEVIRVGRHRQVARGAEGGSSGRSACRATPCRARPGPDARGRATRPTAMPVRARPMIGRGRSPQRGRPSQHEREAEIDAEQHGQPGEHAADQRQPRRRERRRRDAHGAARPTRPARARRRPSTESR